MKHLLLLLSCCLLATSCSKDETPASDELVGTVWSQTVEDRTNTIYFAIDHKCTVEWKYNGLNAVKHTYQYVYALPIVTISTLATEHIGRIEGDILYIRFYDDDLELHRIR